MPLRAVIFDYGEVLSGPPNKQFHRALLETSGLPEDLFERLYWTYRLDFDANILDGSTYWQKIAQDAGTSFTAEQMELMNQSRRQNVDGSESNHVGLGVRHQRKPVSRREFYRTWA